MLPRLEQNLYLLRRVVGKTPGITPLLATPSAHETGYRGILFSRSCPFSGQKRLPRPAMPHRPQLTYSKVKVGKYVGGDVHEMITF